MVNPQRPSSSAESAPARTTSSGAEDGEGNPPCVMVFNATDPSGAGGLAADLSAMGSVGSHALPVVTGAYARDTTETLDFFPFDEEAIGDQARCALEDIPVQAIKVGFAGSPEAISTIAEIAADYSDVPLISYMPNLSWWQDGLIDQYLDAFSELLLPQTTVLVGNHSTLWRWLLPDWTGDRNPGARDIAKAAAEFGVPYTLVTGIPLPEQHIENALVTPQSVLVSEKFERFEATFSGAGDTLSAALTALLAAGADLPSATTEALAYLDHCLDSGFRPGMGHFVPDRMFWAQPDEDDADADSQLQDSLIQDATPPHHETKH